MAVSANVAADQLHAVTAGLLLPSESEAPFEVVTFAALGPADESYLRNRVGISADTPVEEVTLDHLLRNIAFDHDWHDDGQRADVPRFAAMKTVCESVLTDLHVFRVGNESVIDVYILGMTEDGVAGLKSSVVET